MTRITNDGTIMIDVPFYKTPNELKGALAMIIRTQLEQFTDKDVSVIINRGLRSADKDEKLCVSIRMTRYSISFKELAACCEVVCSIMEDFGKAIHAIDDLKPLVCDECK